MLPTLLMELSMALYHFGQNSLWYLPNIILLESTCLSSRSSSTFRKRIGTNSDPSDSTSITRIWLTVGMPHRSASTHTIWTSTMPVGDALGDAYKCFSRNTISLSKNCSIPSAIAAHCSVSTANFVLMMLKAELLFNTKSLHLTIYPTAGPNHSLVS